MKFLLILMEVIFRTHVTNSFLFGTINFLMFCVNHVYVMLPFYYSTSNSSSGSHRWLDLNENNRKTIFNRSKLKYFVLFGC